MTRARTLADLGSQSLATDAELASGLASKANVSDVGVLGVYYAESTAGQVASVATNNWVDVTNLSITLTPKSASSSFLIVSNVYGALDDANYSGSISSAIKANSTFIAYNGALLKTADTYNQTSHALMVKHSPNTTSSVTYKVQVSQAASSAARTIYVNRYVGSSTQAGRSTLHILELPS